MKIWIPCFCTATDWNVDFVNNFEKIFEWYSDAYCRRIWMLTVEGGIEEIGCTVDFELEIRFWLL